MFKSKLASWFLLYTCLVCTYWTIRLCFHISCVYLCGFCLSNPSIEGGWTRIVICTPLYIVFNHYASNTDQNGEFDNINRLCVSMICLRSVDSRYSKSISVGISYKCANLRQNTVTLYMIYFFAWTLLA